MHILHVFRNNESCLSLNSFSKVLSTCEATLKDKMYLESTNLDVCWGYFQGTLVAVYFQV